MINKVHFFNMAECVRKCTNKNIDTAWPKRLFYGATKGLNNMLGLLHLDSRDDLVIFDGDETKTGKFLPACKNPIRHATDSSYKPFDKVFVSAMTFHQEIIEFLRDCVGIHCDGTDDTIETLVPFDKGDP